MIRLKYCSVAQSCLTLCSPMDGSTPGFPVLHHLLDVVVQSPPHKWGINTSRGCGATCHPSTVPLLSHSTVNHRRAWPGWGVGRLAFWRWSSLGWSTRRQGDQAGAYCICSRNVPGEWEASTCRKRWPRCYSRFSSWRSPKRHMGNHCPAEINQADATTPEPHLPERKCNFRIPQEFLQRFATSATLEWPGLWVRGVHLVIRHLLPWAVILTSACSPGEGR